MIRDLSCPRSLFYEEGSFEDHAAAAYGESGREEANQLAAEYKFNTIKKQLSQLHQVKCPVLHNIPDTPHW